MSCQGFQSCFEPLLLQPRIPRNKSSPLKPKSSQSFPRHKPKHRENSHNEEENKNGESGVWSFIQSLTNISHNCEANEEVVYVHPLSKHCASTLSMKSLEMCTESLGSETGSDNSETSSDEFSSLSWNFGNSHPTQKSKSREFTGKLIPKSSFPPPLTSISGSDSVRVRPHREGGRLVIEAITISSCDGYFQAERDNGRLRLCLVKDISLNCHNGVAEGKDEDGGGVEDGDDEWVEGIGGNSENVGGGIGIGEVLKPSNCKEGGGNFGWPFLKALC